MLVPRTLTSLWLEISEQFPVLLLTGPRQVGKAVRHVSNVAGHRQQWCPFPFARLKDVAGQTKTAPNDQQADEPRSW